MKTGPFVRGFSLAFIDKSLKIISMLFIWMFTFVIRIVYCRILYDMVFLSIAPFICLSFTIKMVNLNCKTIFPSTILRIRFIAREVKQWLACFAHFVPISFLFRRLHSSSLGHLVFYCCCFRGLFEIWFLHETTSSSRII